MNCCVSAAESGSIASRQSILVSVHASCAVRIQSRTCLEERCVLLPLTKFENLVGAQGQGKSSLPGPPSMLQKWLKINVGNVQHFTGTENRADTDMVRKTLGIME